MHTIVITNMLIFTYYQIELLPGNLPKLKIPGTISNGLISTYPFNLLLHKNPKIWGSNTTIKETLLNEMLKVAKPRTINVNTGKIIIDLELNINFIIKDPMNYNIDEASSKTLAPLMVYYNIFPYLQGWYYLTNIHLDFQVKETTDFNPTSLFSMVEKNVQKCSIVLPDIGLVSKSAKLSVVSTFFALTILFPMY